MATTTASDARSRERLSRERVLQTAIEQADDGGLEALTMRTLADELEVAPMALYRHIANKDDLVDAMVDVVFSEIGLPASGADWMSAMRQRAIAVRDALLRHRWAIGLMESRRTPRSSQLAASRRGHRQASSRRVSPSRWPPTRTRCWIATSMASP